MSSVRLLTLLIGLALVLTAQTIGPATASSASTAPVTVAAPQAPIEIDAGACNKAVRYTVFPGTVPVGGTYDVTATLRNKAGKRFGTDSDVLLEDRSYDGRILPSCGKAFTSGTYTIDVEVVVNDSYFDPVETRTGSAKVQLKVTRAAPTKLIVTKTPYGSRGWQWTGRLTSGGKPVAGQQIELWWDLLGWADYDVTKRTDGRGIAHWVSNPNGGLGSINFQLRYAGSSNYKPSRSTVFNIAPR